jgi:hypothetical protein
VSHNQVKCELEVCTCFARADDSYCSEYCRQAFSQGAERNFCQCSHVSCTKPVHTSPQIHLTGLPESISFEQGRVLIEYSDEQDLRNQLLLLATRLDTEIGTEVYPRKAACRAVTAGARRTA